MIETTNGRDLGLESTEKGKLLQQVTGIETEGKPFAIDKDSIEDITRTQAINKFNEQVDEYTERFNKYNEAIEKESENIDISKLEIKPYGFYLLIKPFKQNPFQRIKQEGRIITDLGGLVPLYKSNETGEIEEEDPYVHVGTVIEVGPDVKYVQQGDAVMWTAPTELPIPFYKQGLVTVVEQNIKAIINVGLNERFNKIKNNGR